MSDYKITIQDTGNKVTIIDDQVKVTVVDEQIRVVSIAQQGPPGIDGEPGDLNKIVSVPLHGEYKVTNIRLDASKEGINNIS